MYGHMVINVFCYLKNDLSMKYKMLSYNGETELQVALVLAKSGRMKL